MACQCEICPECNGSGTVWTSFSGEYLGNNRYDDLDELDTCPVCDGDGLSYFCPECDEAWREEEERQYFEYVEQERCRNRW